MTLKHIAVAAIALIALTDIMLIWAAGRLERMREKDERKRRNAEMP